MATLAEAFCGDPVWSWAIPNEERRSSQFIALWTLFASSAVTEGWVWSTQRAEAVAIWNPPGSDDLPKGEEAHLERLIGATFGEDSPRITAALQAFSMHRPSSPDHFYLNMLGVRNRDRGRGLGMVLLEENLRLVDVQRAPAYLESSNPDNVDRYQSVGFEVVETFVMPDGGPPVTTMWRSAR